MNGTPDTVAGDPAAPDAASGTLAPLPTLAEATAVWLRIGCLSFGGAAAQIAMLHKVVVEEKRWVEERRFLDALNYLYVAVHDGLNFAHVQSWSSQSVEFI